MPLRGPKWYLRYFEVVLRGPEKEPIINKKTKPIPIQPTAESVVTLVLKSDTILVLVHKFLVQKFPTETEMLPTWF